MHIVKLTLALLATTAASMPAMAAGPVCDATWHDAARNRDVPVRIRMPDGADKAPLILFSHGLGGSLDGGTLWAQAWADAGFVVIHLQHPGSDRSIIQKSGGNGSGGRLRLLRRLRQGGGGGEGGGQIGEALRDAMTPEQLEARVGDVKFVLDQIPAHTREGACALNRIDMMHIGMSGHSFGAHTTQALAEQKFAQTTSATPDPRIAAFVAFSPSPPIAGSDAEAMAGITRPFFSITGTADTTPAASQVSAADRERPFRAMPPGGKYLLVMAGGTHANFSGNARGGFRQQGPSEHLKSVVIDASTAFWRWTLTGDEAARRALDDSKGIRALLAADDRLERR